MKKVFVNALPKSGTNLVAKALQLFGYMDRGYLDSGLVLRSKFSARVRRIYWCPAFRNGYLLGIDTPVEVRRAPIDRLLMNVGDGGFLTAHCGYTVDLLRQVLEKGFAPIIVTRDPRAVLASFVSYVSNERVKHPLYSVFNRLEPRERFVSALYGICSQKGTLQPMKVRCMALEEWIKHPDVLHVTFEDLVGSQGGGSKDTQLELMGKICRFLDISEGKIDVVVDNVFGAGRHTFRKGLIDSWRGEIPDDVVSLANIELADILDAWGYAR